METKEDAAYGSFVSIGFKTILSNQAITWNESTIEPKNMLFAAGGTEIQIEEEGNYLIHYTVRVHAGHAALLYLTVGDKVIDHSRQVLPVANGQVYENLILHINGGSRLTLATLGEAVTLSTHSNAFLTINRV